LKVCRYSEKIEILFYSYVREAFQKNYSAIKLAQALTDFDGRHHFKDLLDVAFEILKKMDPEMQRAIGIRIPCHFPFHPGGEPENSVSKLTLQSLRSWATETLYREQHPSSIKKYSDLIQQWFEKNLSS
jgi:hypothetical protein